jgi:hypothetical protein
VRHGSAPSWAEISTTINIAEDTACAHLLRLQRLILTTSCPDHSLQVRVGRSKKESFLSTPRFPSLFLFGEYTIFTSCSFCTIIIITHETLLLQPAQ